MLTIIRLSHYFLARELGQQRWDYTKLWRDNAGPRVNSYFALSGRLRLIIWKRILANKHIKNMFPEIDKGLTLNAERKIIWNDATSSSLKLA